MARQLGAVRQIISMLMELGRLCLAQGDYDEAIRHLEEGERLALRSNSLGGRRGAACLLAEYDLQHGRARAACTRLSPLLDRPGLQETDVTALLVCLAWAKLELDEVCEAEHLVAHAATRLRADNFQLTLADALRVQGLAAIRERHWQQAAQALEEGLTLAQPMPYPYGEARLLYVYGMLHRERGETTQAYVRLEAALGIFERLGARPEAERTAQLLATLA